MCKELEAELVDGDDAVDALVRHFVAMGAANMRVTRVVNGDTYEVTVECKGNVTSPVAEVKPLQCPHCGSKFVYFYKEYFEGELAGTELWQCQSCDVRFNPKPQKQP